MRAYSLKTSLGEQPLFMTAGLPDFLRNGEGPAASLVPGGFRLGTPGFNALREVRRVFLRDHFAARRIDLEAVPIGGGMQIGEKIFCLARKKRAGILTDFKRF